MSEVVTCECGIDYSTRKRWQDSGCPEEKHKIYVFVCDLCDYTTEDRDAMYGSKGHVSSIHSPDPLPCYCGATYRVNDGVEYPRSSMTYCEDCPPLPCKECGGGNNATQSCSCWKSLEDESLADLKGIFAGMGLSVEKVRD